jgi:two-component system CheB/CheR fusion protein
MKLLVNILISFSQRKTYGIPQTEIKAALLEGRATDNRWHICKDQSSFYAYGLVFCLWKKGDVGYVKILRDLTDEKNQRMLSKNM